MPRLLVVKTGSTLARLRESRGDYEDWIAQGASADAQTVRISDGDELPDAGDFDGVVITGSSAYVTDRLDWSERCARWLPDAVARGTPVLGICYGHQLLAHALGGEVGASPAGREIGTVEVELTEDGLRDALLGSVGEPRLCVQASHRQVVRRLPDGARRLASNEHDANQAFAVGSCAWGVQFHPEWDHDVVRAYLEERDAVLREEGLDPDALVARVRASHHGAAILRRFGEMLG